MTEVVTNISHLREIVCAFEVKNFLTALNFEVAFCDFQLEHLCYSELDHKSIN
jgi:hypothetical protein